MGYYTEHMVACRLKPTCPCEIIDKVKRLTHKDLDSLNFKGDYIFRNPLVSYQGGEPPTFDEKALILVAYGCLKDYEDDIEAFHAWFGPWVDEGYLDYGAYAKWRGEMIPDWTLISKPI